MSKSFSQIVVSALLAGGLCSVASAKADSDSLATELNQHLKVNNSKFLGIPVGFKGNMSTRVHQGTFMGDVPQFATAYSNRLVPDADLNLRIEANPRPEITVSTVLNFGYNFIGNYRNDYQNTAYLGKKGPAGVQFDENRAFINRSPEREGVSMMEEMIAAIDIRTSKVKAKLEAGSALWVEMSPFTIWRRDPRPRHSWYYETYDPEYKAETRNLYNMFTRNDWGGTSVWPRKTFGGAQLDLYELPMAIKAKFLLSEPANFRPGNQTGTSLSHWGDVEAATSLSNMGHVFGTRLSQTGWLPTQEVGFNYLGIVYNDDLINECVVTNFGNKCVKYQFEHDSKGYQPEFFEPHVFSVDSRGLLSGSLYLHTDFAFSYENKTMYALDSLSSFGQAEMNFFNNDSIAQLRDSSFYFDDAVAMENDTAFFNQPGLSETDSKNRLESLRDSALIADRNENFDVLRSKSDFKSKYFDPTYGKGESGIAAYAKLYQAGGALPFSLEFAYIERNFVSPYSMTEFAVPVVASEMTLGTGSNNYRPNMMGVNVVLMPNLLNGYLRFTYGAHSQIEADKDILRFQHKLVGRDLWKSSFSWSRTDPRTNFDVGHATNTQDRSQLRMGDWSDDRNQLFGQDQRGGYLGDDLELWERFHFVDDAQLNVYKAKDASYDLQKAEIAPAFGELKVAYDKYATQTETFNNTVSSLTPIDSNSSNAEKDSYNKAFGDAKTKYDLETAEFNKVNDELADSVSTNAMSRFENMANLDTNKAKYPAPSEVKSTKKFAATASLDYGIHLSALWRGQNHVFLNIFAEYDQITSDAAGLLTGLGSKMLTSKLLTSEVSVNVFDGFYIIGTAGYETFYSSNTIRNSVIGNGIEQSADHAVSAYTYAGEDGKSGSYGGEAFALNYSPIDYEALAAGIGFDWDFSERAGLHFRYKWMQHKDLWAKKFVEKVENLQEELRVSGNDNAALILENYKIKNDYELGFFFLETKVWF